MKKQMIGGLRVGDEVETQAVVLEANRAPFTSGHRAGEFFLKLALSDASGRVKAVMWEPPAAEEVRRGDVVFVRGSVSDYHGPQVVVSGLRRLDPQKVNRAFFLPESGRDRKEMERELHDIIDKEIETPALRELLENFFTDPQFAGHFTQAPAARTVHHNYLGGLLEHTLEVVALSRGLAALHPQKIRPDLLITGAILHDMGKIEEYDPRSLSFEFSDRGRLVGHISIGKEMLDRRLEALSGFPPALRLELEHMLLSHHGQREWGSPEEPKTIHAFALFHADLASARLNQFALVMDRHSPGAGDWSEWDRFLERSVYTRLPDNGPGGDGSSGNGDQSESIPEQGG